jgi:Uma2 family endonuclease
MTQPAAAPAREPAYTDRLNELLGARLSGRALIRVQNPLALPMSRPYPDLAVLRRRPDYYATGKPEPSHVFLVIEVADTSLARDRDLKLPAYGRAGIPECWIVDLAGDGVIVGREPGPGGYGRMATHRRGERLLAPGFPDVGVAADEALGPPPSP